MIITRQDQEKNEAKLLAPYGIKSKNTQGRKYPEEEDTYRTCFQRDHDRIIHTTAFRRLEYKTQVFVNYEGDYYRTRLTHTLEVAQVGRSLAQALAVNPDLTECICLAHDLGHSPFGHSGETILNELMKEHGGFNHNHQTYRILTELEQRYPGWSGLNLSYELLEGIAKHETRYDLSRIEGYDPSTRGTLEAQIANISDELAYNTHDLDDGLRSGLLHPDQLKDLEIWRLVQDSVGWDGNNWDDMVRHRMIRRLVGLEIEDVIMHTHNQIVEQKVKTAADIQRLPHDVIGYSANFHRMNDQLKDFEFEYLISHYRVVRMSFKAQRFVEQLFQAYIARPRQLPPHVQQRADEVGLHRSVADYIAGMTDRYALQEWQRIFDPFTLP